MQKKGSSVFPFVLLLILLFSTSCTSEEIKKSENSVRIHALYDSLEHLKKSYEAKNSDDFLSDYSTNYPNLDAIKKSTKDLFDRYPHITLQFYLDHIVLEPASSSLVLRWEGEWSQTGEGALKSAGNSVFRFSNETRPLLIEIQGINPFTSPLKDTPS